MNLKDAVAGSPKRKKIFRGRNSSPGFALAMGFVRTEFPLLRLINAKTDNYMKVLFLRIIVLIKMAKLEIASWGRDDYNRSAKIMVK